MKFTTLKRWFLVLFGLTGLFAALCSTGCSSDKNGDNAPSGKAPAASAPPTTEATPDASRAKPGSNDPGAK